MGGAGEPGTDKKNDAGKAVGRRAADDGDEGLLAVNSQHAESGDGGPAQDVTESHEEKAGNQPGGGAFPELRKVRRLFEDGPDGFHPCQALCKFPPHGDGFCAGISGGSLSRPSRSMKE